MRPRIKTRRTLCWPGRGAAARGCLPRFWLILTFSCWTAAQAIGFAGPAKSPCIAPVPASGSPADCTFDIWGYVTDSKGDPIEGALIRDVHNGFETYSDANGFFDLYERSPGSYTISAFVVFPGGTCNRVLIKWVGPEALVFGGAREDFDLDFCNRG